MKIAESAALILSAAEAQHGQAEGIARAAEADIERLTAGEKRADDASVALTKKRSERSTAETASNQLGAEEQGFRIALETARATRESCEALLEHARRRSQAFMKAAAAQRAVTTRNALMTLEARECESALKWDPFKIASSH